MKNKINRPAIFLDILINTALGQDVKNNAHLMDAAEKLYADENYNRRYRQYIVDEDIDMMDAGDIARTLACHDSTYVYGDGAAYRHGEDQSKLIKELKALFPDHESYWGPYVPYHKHLDLRMFEASQAAMLATAQLDLVTGYPVIETTSLTKEQQNGLCNALSMLISGNNTPPENNNYFNPVE